MLGLVVQMVRLVATGLEYLQAVRSMPMLAEAMA